MPDGKSFEQLEKEKKAAEEAKAKAEAEKKADPLVLEEDDEFEEFEQEGAPGFSKRRQSQGPQRECGCARRQRGLLAPAFGQIAR